MLFVLTNPGQLNLYDDDCLSSLMSQLEKKTSVPTMQYPMVIPALEPYMTTARFGVVSQDVKSFRALSEVMHTYFRLQILFITFIIVIVVVVLMLCLHFAVQTLTIFFKVKNSIITPNSKGYLCRFLQLQSSIPYKIRQVWV